MAEYESKTQDGKCIFCEIVKGSIPASSFWEDEKYMAFPAIDPNTLGFSVVIPKEHFGSDVMKMPDPELKEFIISAKKVSAILEKYFTDVGRIGVIMEGTGVDHAHIKLVPMHDTEYLKNGGFKQYISKGEPWYSSYEGFITSMGGPRANQEELKELAQKIKESY